jgi:hypothetical protein
LLEAGGSTRVTVRPNGNVGIGVANPNNQLEVNGVAIFRETSGISRPAVTHLAISPTNAINYIESANGLSPRPIMMQASELTFTTGTTTLGEVQAMHINNAGQVGIGTSSPTAQLEVNGNIEIPATSNYTYSTARTVYQSHPANAFQLAISAGTTFNSIGLGSTPQGGSIWAAGGSVALDANFYAPVYIPDGATVTNVEFYVLDNDASYEVVGYLYRTGLGSLTETIMAQTNGSGGALANVLPIAIIDNTIINPVIDNGAFTYFLRFQSRQNTMNLRLLGARITYTVTQAQ